MLPKSFLVPTDLSDEAAEVLDYACELAEPLGASIHLLHAIASPPLAVPELATAFPPDLLDSMIGDARTAIEQLAEARRGRARFGERMVRVGNTGELIEQAAEEVQADLIVMGTHGRRGLSRALLGSIAEHVIRTAPCPVLAVRRHTTSHPHFRAA